LRSCDGTKLHKIRRLEFSGVVVFVEKLQKFVTAVSQCKDPWWDGEQTQDQAKRHLLEVDAWIATTGRNYAALDIYDNSSGHNCMAIDALNSEKLSIGEVVRIK
jgi:hypothetical protein